MATAVVATVVAIVVEIVAIAVRSLDLRRLDLRSRRMVVVGMVAGTVVDMAAGIVVAR